MAGSSRDIVVMKFDRWCGHEAVVKMSASGVKIYRSNLPDVMYQYHVWPAIKMWPVIYAGSVYARNYHILARVAKLKGWL